MTSTLTRQDEFEGSRPDAATAGSGTLWLGRHSRSTHQLSVQFGLGDLRFSASYWYGDVDLCALERRYGVEYMEGVYFHITAFTANTLVSLRPDFFDPGPYARFCGRDFWTLWQRVFRGVWAQWRFQHDLPDYCGPDLVRVASAPGNGGDRPQPVRVVPGRSEVLAFFGGGKDSVVSLRLLEGAGLACDTLVYSSSVYGSAARQHKLCDSLLDALGTDSNTRRRMWGYDDLTDSPIVEMTPQRGTLSLTAAETPASLFASLPLVLEHGYTSLCLGHERSADASNLVWQRTGEPINHQWGKSADCECLLANYIRSQLVENCDYFSTLKAVFDPLIFAMLAQDLESVPLTHSCNVSKPWCGQCAKCAYVWLGYSAYLPGEIVKRTFAGHGNLFDVPGNLHFFRQLLGLTSHTPFECVGGIDETRLAFELCRRRGLRGTAMVMFEREMPTTDVAGLLEKYFAVDATSCSLPGAMREAVLDRLRVAAEQARRTFAHAP